MTNSTSECTLIHFLYRPKSKPIAICFLQPMNSAHFGSSDIPIHIGFRESLLVDEVGFYDRNPQ